MYLAVFGSSDQVFIFDRTGKNLDQFDIRNPYLVDWDSQSDALAVTSKGTSVFLIYFLASKDIREVECEIETSFISFSPTGSFFAAGSPQGKWWIYDSASNKSQLYQGVHDQKIIDGAWNQKKHICFCSEDQSISLNKINGENLARKELNDVVQFPQFIKIDHQNHVLFSSVNLARFYIWKYESDEEVRAINLSSSNGNILRMSILSNFLIFIQFNRGKSLICSFDSEVIAEHQAFTNTAIKVDVTKSIAVISTGNSVKSMNLIDPSNIYEEQARFPPQSTGEISTVALTPDAQMVSVGLSSGTVLTYILEVPCTLR